MKVIASILAAFLLLLGSESLLETIQFPVDAAEMSCCSDGSSCCCSQDEDQHSSKDACDEEQDCLPGCDCSFQFQITAITYSFMEFSGVVVQSYHYGHYVNSYSFEYSEDFLHPPRFG
jgi:hypothetical protein